MVVFCNLLCRKESGGSESTVVLSPFTRDLLTALRYRLVMATTVSHADCGSSEHLLALVQLLQEERTKGPSSYRLSQSLTRIRCLLKTVGQGDASALNTLAIVIALISPVLSHPRRHDLSLRLGRSYLNHGYTWMLFGENVYDIVTNDEVERLEAFLRETLLWFGVDGWDGLARQAAVERALLLFVKPSLLLEIQQQWVQHTLVDPCYSHTVEQYDDGGDTLNEAIAEIKASILATCQIEFPRSRLQLYGSLHAGLALDDTDVDLSLELLPNEACGFSRKDSQSILERVVLQLQTNNPSIIEARAASNARVPVVQGTFRAKNDDLLDFDITLNNHLGVANSELLRQYTLVDVRIKTLMRTIKQWAKQEGISSTKDQHLSSYGWMNLVIFYLQQLGFIPNLQCSILRAQNKIQCKSRLCKRTAEDLDVDFLTWKQASLLWEMPGLVSNLSLDRLLLGFFQFYTEIFPTAFFVVSIRRGSKVPSLKKKLAPTSDGLFLCIEDPFESFDSVAPHDLGRHVNSAGAVRIADKMHLAKAELQATSPRFQLCEGTSKIAEPSGEQVVHPTLRAGKLGTLHSSFPGPSSTRYEYKGISSLT